MTLSHLKIVGVVGRCDFHHASAELHIHIGIRHHGNFPVYNGQHHLFANNILISPVLGIDGHSGISQHGFRSGSGKFQEFFTAYAAVLLNKRILNVPEMARLLRILHLRIGNGRVAHRTPVDDTAGLVNPAFFMHSAENFRHSLIAALVHGKTFPVPVAGRAQLF